MLAVDDRHVAFCEYNGSVARIICVAVATLANENFLERASDNDLLLCKKSTSNKTRFLFLNLISISNQISLIFLLFLISYIIIIISANRSTFRANGPRANGYQGEQGIGRIGN